MDIIHKNGQVNILFENNEEIDFLINMCYACIDYELTDEYRERAKDILEILDY